MLETLSRERVLTDARLVLPGEVAYGSIAIENGRIMALDRGRSRAPGAIELDGDLLMPGLIDLHTDNLEKHFQPRAGVTWDGISAAIAHDAQVASAGITTVYDSLTLGAASGWDARDELVEPMIAGLMQAQGRGMLRIDHRLHLRCEITHKDIIALFDAQRARGPVDLVSLMDHAPGDRQSPDIETYRRRYRGFGMSDEAVAAHIDGLIEGSRQHGPANCRGLAARAHAAGIPLATHDDASPAHVATAIALGACFTEFPTTIEAARAARDGDLPVLMGTPNLLRGGSHSGNVAAGTLVESGLLDLLASDYIPASLIKGAFRLAEPPFALPLHQAIATVTANAARIVGLTDRGRIAPGLRADLVRVRLIDGRPIVREVWRAGERVA